MDDPAVYWKYQEELDTICDDNNNSADELPDIPEI